MHTIRRLSRTALLITVSSILLIGLGGCGADQAPEPAQPPPRPPHQRPDRPIRQPHQTSSAKRRRGGLPKGFNTLQHVSYPAYFRTAALEINHLSGLVGETGRLRSLTGSPRT